jgi:hypothetical protein
MISGIQLALIGLVYSELKTSKYDLPDSTNKSIVRFLCAIILHISLNADC